MEAFIETQTFSVFLPGTVDFLKTIPLNKLEFVSLSQKLLG